MFPMPYDQVSWARSVPFMNNYMATGREKLKLIENETEQTNKKTHTEL